MVKRLKVEDSVDRISSLPDSVLGHILSLLPTKDAVSTCILLNGSRWTDIFPFSNNLDFDESLVYKLPRNDRLGRTKRFKDFVGQCIMLMKGMHIHKFRLKCTNAVKTSRIHSWIRSALCSNLRELDLCIGTRDHGKEYSLVFKLERNALVVLKLGAGISFNVTASVYFPCLKIVHLKSIRLVHNNDSIQRLVSSCPVLEDLLIVGCDMKDVTVLSLSSPSLKRFAIDKPHRRDPYKLSLDTPSLVYLNFAVCRGEEHMLKKLGSVREAHVNISYWLEGRIDYPQLLEGFGNVQSLYLYGQVRKYLREGLGVLEELPLLKNLTHLVLTGKLYVQLPVVIKLLQYCPYLEEFVTNGSIRGGYDAPCCLPSRLKSIECELFYVVGTSQHKGVEPLEYFLKNANMLEKMQIHVPSGCFATHGEVIDKLETMMVTMNELAKAPSRSKICEINVFFRGERVLLWR